MGASPISKRDASPHHTKRDWIMICSALLALPGFPRGTPLKSARGFCIDTCPARNNRRKSRRDVGPNETRQDCITRRAASTRRVVDTKIPAASAWCADAHSYSACTRLTPTGRSFAGCWPRSAPRRGDGDAYRPPRAQHRRPLRHRQAHRGRQAAIPLTRGAGGRHRHQHRTADAGGTRRARRRGARPDPHPHRRRQEPRRRQRRQARPQAQSSPRTSRTRPGSASPPATKRSTRSRAATTSTTARFPDSQYQHPCPNLGTKPRWR
jgi:hypothetical protein